MAIQFDVTRITKPRYEGKGLKILTIKDLNQFNGSYRKSGGKVFWKQ